MTNYITWRMVEALIPNGTRLVHYQSDWPEAEPMPAWTLECPDLHGDSDTGWIVLARGATLEECLRRYDERESDERWWKEQIDGPQRDRNYGLWREDAEGEETP